MLRRQIVRQAIVYQYLCIIVSVFRVIAILPVIIVYLDQFQETPISVWLYTLATIDIVFLPKRVYDVREFIDLKEVNLEDFPTNLSLWLKFRGKLDCYYFVTKFELLWYIAGSLCFFLSAQARFTTPAVYWLMFSIVIPVFIVLGFIVLFLFLFILREVLKKIKNCCLLYVFHTGDRNLPTSTVVVTIHSNPETRQAHVSTSNEGMCPESITRIPLVQHIKNVDTKAEAIDEPICAICLNSFEEGILCRSLPCKHVYHPECIDTWLLRSHRCPLCNDNILSGLKNVP